ncbi:hypothetical protein [Candidatus Thiosymbion oneisti]|uniref:hypothetical protein n=1 Tax=Candidatus Thiosymbion oneisti TaxID=589554 RepID=UPI00105C3DA5|nr:hypothetical protein [Candidatus Thiosymbion oneisti]
MTTLRERNIEIEIPDALNGRKFDDRTHGLSHCMKAVDFIVELTDRILFIEIKNPPDTASLPPNAKGDYVEQFLSGGEDAEFYYKCRDSFLYEWAAKRTKKPIYYLILVAFARLTKADLVARTEALKRKLPVVDAVPETAGWQGSFVAGCAVFNLDTWNQAFPTYSARRISA